MWNGGAGTQTWVTIISDRQRAGLYTFSVPTILGHPPSICLAQQTQKDDHRTPHQALRVWACVLLNCMVGGALQAALGQESWTQDPTCIWLAEHPQDLHLASEPQTQQRPKGDSQGSKSVAPLCVQNPLGLKSPSSLLCELHVPPATSDELDTPWVLDNSSSLPE